MNHTDGKDHARRQAFALVSQLKSRFNQRGISESDLWDAIKSDFGVSSRKQIGELGWTLLSARLQAAQRHSRLFDSFCRKIKKGVGN